MSSPFEAHTCGAPPERAGRMRDIVLEYVPRDRAIHVLDIGCGTGSLAFGVAGAVLNGSVTGIDLSAANIAAAERNRASDAAGPRVRFERADYLAYGTAPVDVIVTDTVLHFIRGRPADLWGKLARDLRDGGLLVCCMAYDCTYNRALTLARTVLRAVRSRPLDALVAAAGRRAYGCVMDDRSIRERTEYMFIPPEQLLTNDIVETVAPSLGLRLLSRRDMPGTSATQLKQHLIVFQKDCRSDD